VFFTCGNVVGEHWEEFKERAREGDEDPARCSTSSALTGTAVAG